MATTEQATVALINSRIGHLTACRDHIETKTCPLLQSVTGKVTPEPKAAKPRKAKAEKARVKTKRVKPEPATVDVPMATSHRGQSSKNRSKDESILTLIRESKGLTASELADKTGDTTANVYCRCRRLVRDAKLTIGASKKYHVAVAQAED